MHGIARLAVLGLAAAVLWSSPGSSQTLDPRSSAGLDAVLRILMDPTQRQGAISGSPEATAADARVRSIMGSEALRQEFYALAALVMSDLVRSTGGDVGKMTESLERARTDPAAFAASLSPATREQLRAFAAKVESSRPR